MSSAKSEIQKRYLKEFKGMYDQLEEVRKKIDKKFKDKLKPSKTDGVFKTYVGKKI